MTIDKTLAVLAREQTQTKAAVLSLETKVDMVVSRADKEAAVCREQHEKTMSALQNIAADLRSKPCEAKAVPAERKRASWIGSLLAVLIIVFSLCGIAAGAVTCENILPPSAIAKVS